MIRIKSTNAVVCEHCIEGKSNKHTLINTMAGDILVEKFPANLPIAFYIEFTSSEAGHANADIKIMLGRKKVAGGSASILFNESKIAVLAVPSALLVVDAPTTIKLIIQWEGNKPATVVSKSFILAATSAQDSL